MRSLTWTKNAVNNYEGHIAHILMFTVAYYPERGWFISPKLPGLNKTVPVATSEAGQRRAEEMCRRWIEFLDGSKWTIS